MKVMTWAIEYTTFLYSLILKVLKKFTRESIGVQCTRSLVFQSQLSNDYISLSFI